MRGCYCVRGVYVSVKVKYRVVTRAAGYIRLDDGHLLQTPLLGQLSTHFAGLVSRSTSSSLGGRRQGRQEASAPSALARRLDVPCENWNLGICAGDKCQYRRRHNVCSECGGQHRAKEVEQCHSSLLARRNGRSGPRPTAGPSGSKRT